MIKPSKIACVTGTVMDMDINEIATLAINTILDTLETYDDCLFMDMYDATCDMLTDGGHRALIAMGDNGEGEMIATMVDAMDDTGRAALAALFDAHAVVSHDTV